MADAQIVPDFASALAQLVPDYSLPASVGYRSHLGWMLGVNGVTLTAGAFNAYWAISSSRILGGGDR